MASVDLAAFINSGLQPSSIAAAKVPYQVGFRVDIAAAVTAKGTALAAADVLNVIDIPADTIILGAGAKKTTAPTGTVSVCTLSIGPNGAGTKFVNAFDYYAAATGDNFTQVPGGMYVKTSGATTLDLTITALTGTLLTGYIDVWVLLMDEAKINQPGIAALRS